MKRKEQEKDRKKATENELKKEWVNIMVKKNHSTNRQNLIKITWVSLNLLPK